MQLVRKELIFLLVTVLITLVTPIVLEGVTEKHMCEDIPVAKEFDNQWLLNVPYFYVPLWNKQELYDNAMDFFGAEKIGEVTQADLDQTCSYWKKIRDSTIIPVSGFNRKEKLFYRQYTDPVRKYIKYWTLPINGTEVYVATSYITKTDNKSYFVMVTISEDNHKGFFVSSIHKEIPTVDLVAIKLHLKDQLHFNPDHFVDYKYNNCTTPDFST